MSGFYEVPVWQLAILQGALVLLAARVIRGRFGWPLDWLRIAAPTAGAFALALVLGVPFWRNEPFGDAHDIAVLTLWATCFTARVSDDAVARALAKVRAHYRLTNTSRKGE